VHIARAATLNRKRQVDYRSRAGTMRCQFGISANVHIEPPVGTVSPTIARAELPPRPDAMLTYCRPL
jgi:hypothetical protein